MIPAHKEKTMATVEMTITASVPLPFNVGGGNPPVTNAETFDGAIPGPTIQLNVGDTLIVRLVNDLPYPTGIHWHGIELENYSDGTEVTQSEVPAAPLQVLGSGPRVSQALCGPASHAERRDLSHARR
jgi:FtsP/CotA-like multicopper oxidase with cupredoxin domain